LKKYSNAGLGKWGGKIGFISEELGRGLGKAQDYTMWIKFVEHISWGYVRPLTPPGLGPGLFQKPHMDKYRVTVSLTSSYANTCETLKVLTDYYYYYY
jgi:hypothetical protein